MKLLLCIGLMFVSIPSFSDAGRTPVKESEYDSLLPQGEFKSGHVAMILDLLDAETDYRKSGNDQKALIHLLRIARVRKVIRGKSMSSRVYFDLASVSARLQMYPQAMRYYYRTVHNGRNAAWITGYADSCMYDDSIGSDSFNLGFIQPGSIVKSEPVRGEEILRSFEDGKTAISYAVLLHVKQPLPGRRKAFTGINNVGHMFITLIKYNSDNSFVSRSFGFYPHKSTILSATPLHPTARSVFKDDARHDWDEMAGKFISHKRFQKIIGELNRFTHQTYNLNQNNCTDFGLCVAIIAGINIMDTRGSWPLGKGNNPANAGQSLLENKFSNTDREDPETLFVSSRLKDINQ